MANIAVNNDCNLQCPYCFASRYIGGEEKQSITMAQLEVILEFLGRSGGGRVGLVGGEPTLHPQLGAILERVGAFVAGAGRHAVLFTNGVLLGGFAGLLREDLRCLVNVNHPGVMGAGAWAELERSMERLRVCGTLPFAGLGVNLYPTLPDHDFIFDLARRCGKECLRVSYAAPAGEFGDADKAAYYALAKEQFLLCTQEAERRGVQIRLDCNHVPRCYFTEAELGRLDRFVTGWRAYCEPVVDITPDFRATACFGAYDPVDLRPFESIRDVERYLLLKKTAPRAEANCGGKCAQCQKHENLSCQGGCLAFSGQTT